MALVVAWEKAAVPMPDGTERVLTRGEALPNEVTDFQRSVMVMIGAVRDIGQNVAAVQAAADEVEAGYQAPPPPAQYPAEVPPVVSVPGASPAVTPAPVNPDPTPIEVADPADDLDKPQAHERKDTWEDYASAKGYLTKAEAESMTKANLIAFVNERETQA